MPSNALEASNESAVISTLSFRPKKQVRVIPPVATTRSSIRLNRQMALAIRFEHLLQAGQVKDYAALATRFDVDRGCISRLMQLTLLAPDLQARVLVLTPSDPALSLRQLLPVCRTANWRIQRRMFAKLLPSD